MARILVSAMPFTGHVTPMRAVAHALVSRGHHVRFYTGSAFRDGVEASGASLVPWRRAPDFDETDLPAAFPRLVGKKGLQQLLINVQDVFIETAPAQVADLREEFDREPWDAIVGDELSLGAVLFDELEHTHLATVAVLPLHLAGSQGPPSGLGLQPGRNPVTRARDALLRAVVPLISRPILGPLSRARAAVDLPASGLGLDRMLFSRELIIASGSPMLDFRRTDRPDELSFVGRLATPASPAPTPAADLPPWWGDLEGRRVVHVTQGTLNTDPDDLIRPALEALADLDALVVVATGALGRSELPFAVPPNARVAGFLPYAQLLPRVDTMITNGGWGGTLAALEHGIPLVIAGGELDKPEIAARVAWTGAGVNLRTGTPNARQVEAGYRRIVTDPSVRQAAAGVAAELRSFGGAIRAAELIEELTAERRSPGPVVDA
ncbi:glycosyltransferase [Microbacterium sp. SD291]|uniref:glycosyltransferase n=1 Tax=Microbacterium sp. SD291 TaxID=2782007 RepID=UPI001A960210|nr:nucleotide disphospho-sugar-binding domain-containing protein [Microbacterium sp. SD291]MBO0980928.1 glycosyl transferase [Microbacterium sp. SD291]